MATEITFKNDNLYKANDFPVDNNGYFMALSVQKLYEKIIVKIRFQIF